MFWEHGPSGRGSRDVAQRVPKKRRGVDFQFDSPSDSVEGMSEQKSGLVKRSEEVADHRERRVRRIFEKNGGSFSSVDTTLDLWDFQNGRQGKIDFDEFSVLSQIRDNISGRTVSHGSAGSVVRFDVETRAKVYAGRIAHLGTRILYSQRNTGIRSRPPFGFMPAGPSAWPPFGFMPAGPRLYSYRFAQKPSIFLPPFGRKKDRGESEIRALVAASSASAGQARREA